MQPPPAGSDNAHTRVLSKISELLGNLSGSSRSPFVGRFVCGFHRDTLLITDGHSSFQPCPVTVSDSTCLTLLYRTGYIMSSDRCRADWLLSSMVLSLPVKSLTPPVTPITRWLWPTRPRAVWPALSTHCPLSSGVMSLCVLGSSMSPEFPRRIGSEEVSLWWLVHYKISKWTWVANHRELYFNRLLTWAKW